MDEALRTLAGFAVGKPVLVEETFPLACSLKELEEFKVEPPMRIQTIREKLNEVRPLLLALAEEWKGIAPDYKVEPNDCLTQEAIADYERQHEVQLPEGYRLFLRTIGNGGPGPLWSGLFPMAYPVTFRSQIDPAVGPEAHMLLVESAVPPRKVNPCKGIPLANLGCGAEWELVISGADRGNIWFFAEGNVEPCQPKCDFLAWYDRWLDSVLTGNATLLNELLESGRNRT
jgi:hypothetical protein